MDGDVEARISVRVADRKPGWVALPRWETVSAGRTHGYALYLRNSWVPAKLCRFLPYDRGWVVQVGPRPRMRVQDRYVGDHAFARRSIVALQEGKTLLSFPDLDDWVQVGVVIGPGAAAGLAPVRDTVIEDERGAATAYAVGRLTLTAKQRQTVAATCAHLLTRAPKATNLTATAAPHLGTSEQVVKNTLGKVRDKINGERWGPKLTSYEQVGHYLIELTRTVTWEDLPPALRR